MRPGRHILIISASLLVLVAFGHWLPKILQLNPASLIPGVSQAAVADTAAPPDTIIFEDGLRNSFPVLRTIKSRARSSQRPEVWIVGNGISIPNYMLRAQRYIHTQKGSVIRMEELHGKTPSAMLTCIDSNGTRLQAEIRIGEAYLDSASRIGVAFMVESLTPATLLGLSRLNYPVTLLVPPFDTSKSLFAMLDQVSDKELVAWIPMEGLSLLDRRLGVNSIQIHHSESEISSTLEEAFRRLPEAAGVATRHGQRAVEHKPLLMATLKPLAKRRMWFWDLTGNRFSRTEEACNEIGARCKTSRPYQPNRGDLESYIQQGLYLARKSGKSAIAMPLNEETLDAMFRFREAAQVQGTEIVKMSTILGEGD